MATLEQAESQVKEARKQIESKRVEAQTARQTLEKARQSLPVRTSQKAMRSTMAGLKGRTYRRNIHKAEQSIRGKGDLIAGYEKQLTKYETEQIKPVEAQIADINARKYALEIIDKAILKGTVALHAMYDEGYVKEYAQDYLKRQKYARQDFVTNIESLKTTLPEGDKLVVDYKNLRVTGIESGGQSLSLDAYNKRIPDINKGINNLPEIKNIMVDTNKLQLSGDISRTDIKKIKTKLTGHSVFNNEMFPMVSAKQVDSKMSIDRRQFLDVQIAPTFKERYQKTIDESGKIKGTLQFLGDEVEDLALRGQTRAVRKFGGKYDPQMAHLQGQVVSGAPYLTPYVGTALFIGGGLETGGREIKRQIESKDFQPTKFILPAVEVGVGVLGLRAEVKAGQKIRDLKKLQDTTPEFQIGLVKKIDDGEQVLVAATRKTKKYKQDTLSIFNIRNLDKGHQVESGKALQKLTEVKTGETSMKKYTFFGEGSDVIAHKVSKLDDALEVLIPINKDLSPQVTNIKILSEDLEPMTSKFFGISKRKGDFTLFAGGEIIKGYKQKIGKNIIFDAGTKMITTTPKYSGAKARIQKFDVLGILKDYPSGGGSGASSGGNIISSSGGGSVTIFQTTTKTLPALAVESKITSISSPKTSNLLTENTIFPIVSSKVIHQTPTSIYAGQGVYERTEAQIAKQSFQPLVDNKVKIFVENKVGVRVDEKLKVGEKYKLMYDQKVKHGYDQKVKYGDLMYDQKVKHGYDQKVKYGDLMYDQKVKHGYDQKVKYGDLMYDQKVKYAEKTKQTTKQTGRQSRPIKPKIPLPKIKIPTTDTAKDKIEQLRIQMFEVYGKRFGKDLLLGETTNPIKAKSILKSFLRSTLGRSGFVKSEGKKIDVSFKSPEFRKSKSDPLRVVQKAKYSLSSGKEQSEIQFFKRKSKRKKKFKFF